MDGIPLAVGRRSPAAALTESLALCVFGDIWLSLIKPKFRFN